MKVWQTFRVQFVRDGIYEFKDIKILRLFFDYLCDFDFQAVESSVLIYLYSKILSFVAGYPILDFQFENLPLDTLEVRFDIQKSLFLSLCEQLLKQVDWYL